MGNAEPYTAIVLIVEDEPIQRLTLVDLVEEAGYQALEAWDAQSAIRILEARSDVRVVLTDIDMPGAMDGIALAAAIRGRWPPIEIILTSAGRSPDQGAIPARTVFLPKPLQHRDARSTLHAMVKDTGGTD